MRTFCERVVFAIIFVSITLNIDLIAQNRPVIESVEGKVIDATTNQELGFCSAALYLLPKDSLVSGVLVNVDGKFLFNNVNPGNYLLRIKFIGYTDFEQKVNLATGNNTVNLGTLKVKPTTTNLNEVEVVTEKSVVSMTIDRKVYNIEKDLSVTGGTGLDAVKNIPSVAVDADGGVSLRNSSVQVFIDGKQSNLTLEQIPSAQIEKIEVITNPSAKFDANTSGGILNVVLKKNQQPGYNGSFTAGLGTNDRYNTGLLLNLKKGKWGYSLNYNYFTQRNNNKGFTKRENLTNYNPIYYFEQHSLNYFTNAVNGGKIAIDYSPNSFNTITISGNLTNPLYRSSDFQDFTSLKPDNTTYATGNRLNENRNTYMNASGQLGYKKTFSQPGKEVLMDAAYTYGSNQGNYLFTTNNYITGQNYIGPELQKNNANGSNQLVTFTTDYVKPINDSTRYEAGIKIYYKQSRATNGTYNYDYNLGHFLFDTTLSNDYLITDMINAAYFNYSGVVSKINYQTGLRFEQSYYDGILKNKPYQSVNYNYPSSGNDLFKALFPSLYLSKKLNPKNEIQLNFSRKINRPGFIQLLPIVLFADKFNYRIGNPALKPEFVNRMEINYNYVTNNVNYLGSLFIKQTQNAHILIGKPSSADPNVLVTTWENSKTNISYGWENIMKITAYKILNVTGTFTPYYLLINYTSPEGTPQKSDGYTFDSKLMISVRLPKDITFQTNGTYEYPRPLAQGKTSELYYFDLSLNKKFKYNITTNIILSDVLNSHQRALNYFTADYNQYLMRRRSSRFFKFNITWNFGKTEPKKKSNKNNKSGGENSEGMDM